MVVIMFHILSNRSSLLQAKDKGVLYPVAQILVNVTNSYDVKKIEPELVETAKFAKQHIPETHEKVSHCSCCSALIVETL